MSDPEIFDALNESQDGRPLGRRLGGFSPRTQEWCHALNDLLVGAYEQASDTDELAAHLRYCTRELNKALHAIGGE